MKTNNYLKASEDNLQQIKDNRRYFHKHAELGFHEFETAKIVSEYLDDLGLEVQTGIAKTGVIGILRCKDEGKTAALRADMDALPIQEKNEVEYASVNDGVMHACGHDGHVAMLMETARLLVKEKHNLKGNIKFIFQPCEDTIPSGAEPMIREGVLENPEVDGIFTVHLLSAFPEGELWVKPGYTSISSADFSVALLGKGGHVSSPHMAIDPIMMAGMLITDGQTLMLKSAQPGKTIIFAFGTVHGGTATNVIPEEVILSGSIRTSSPESLEKGIKDFERMIRGITNAAGGSYKLDIQMANPSIFNNPELVKLLQIAGGKVLGGDNVHEFHDIIPGGDDAAFFQQKVKGVYWLLGTGSKDKGFDKPHHNPYFDFDDDVLALGAAVQAQAVTDFLMG